MRAVLSLLVRIAARRPASWLAAAIALASCLALARAPATAATIAAAVACGGWSAVAAAGHAPRGIAPGRKVDAAGWWARTLWPLAGATGAAVMLGPGFGGLVVAAGAVGILVATLGGSVAARHGAVAADATTFAAFASTSAAATALVAGPPWFAVATAGAAAASILAAAWVAWRLGVGPPGPSAAEPRAPRSLVAEVGLARGGLRRTLVALAMATSLAGLAGWYFLAPEAAAFGCPFAIGWFAALAVPAALIGPPTDRAWQAVAGAAAAPGAGAAAAWRRPTSLRLAVATALGHAAILGWPPLVAGLLQTAEATVGPVPGAAWPWIAVAALAVAAAALAGLAFVAAAVPLERETALATAAGLVAAAAVLAAAGLPEAPIVPG